MRNVPLKNSWVLLWAEVANESMSTILSYLWLGHLLDNPNNDYQTDHHNSQ